MGTFPSPCEATQSGVFNVVVTKPDIFNETWERILPVAFTVTASSHFVVTKPDIFNEEPGNFDLILLRLQEVFQLCVCVCVCVWTQNQEFQIKTTTFVPKRNRKVQNRNVNSTVCVTSRLETNRSVLMSPEHDPT